VDRKVTTNPETRHLESTSPAAGSRFALRQETMGGHDHSTLHARPARRFGRGGDTSERVPFVALERQHAVLANDLREAFDRVVATSGFVLGEEVERFEAEFAEYCGVEHCIGVASGTSALTLLMLAAGIGRGDEVIVPAHTFIASALAVVHAGAEPVFADVDEATGLLDVDSAASVTGPRTAAILPVHLYGQLCDMDAIRGLAERHGLAIFEDAAQAHGARFHGQTAGGFGAGAAFSFYPSKNLGALGDAGAICTDDDEVAERARRLRNLGQRRKGEHLELGYNERLDGLQAALLRVKLRELDRGNAARRAHAARYQEELAGHVELLEERPEAECVYHLFPIRVADSDRVAERMRRAGVDVGIHYRPAVHEHPAWRRPPRGAADLHVAEAWAAHELSLPMFPELTERERERTVAACEAAVAARGADRPRVGEGIARRAATDV
jgi:dTDP-3-amino-3,4,6-trideoxy-alpha-D-glucose transaminase